MARLKSPELAKAIAAVKNGEALASALGITPQALSQWKKVPAGRVIAVERITGVSRQELRPDLFTSPPAQPYDGSDEQHDAHGDDRAAADAVHPHSVPQPVE